MQQSNSLLFTTMYYTKTINSIFLATISILIFASLFLSCLTASAATLSFAPAAGNFTTGTTFTVTIEIDPQRKQFTSIEGLLRFDASFLSVVEITKNDSIIDTWLVEPTFSNNDGSVRFAGLSLPNISFRSTLLNITFRTLQHGVASLGVVEGVVLVNGDEEYKLNSQTREGVYTVVSPLMHAIESTGQVRLRQILESGYIVNTDSFPYFDTWYSAKDATFFWETPTNVNQVAFVISSQKDTVPHNDINNIVEPPISEVFVPKAQFVEGVQYFHLSFNDENGWKKVVTRPINIDSTPPQPFQASLEATRTTNYKPTVFFSATDELSGIHYYEIISQEEPVLVLRPDEIDEGILLSDITSTSHTITIRAYDYAGNFSEHTLVIPKVVGASTATRVMDAFINIMSNGYNILLVLFSFIALLLIAIFLKERYLMMQKYSQLRKETKDMQRQTEKIFTALQEEITEQITTITKKKRLTKEEKTAIAGMNEALDVSKTLLKKEIDDVSTIVKDV
jgi:hypothetical protein